MRIILPTALLLGFCACLGSAQRILQPRVNHRRGVPMLASSGADALFSWSLPADPLFATQEAFELRINATDGSVVCESGQVTGGAQQYRFGTGCVLNGTSTYRWDVRARFAHPVGWTLPATGEFFTAFESTRWPGAVPIWAARCRTDETADTSTPLFATATATLDLDQFASQGSVVSALGFATAATPLWLDNSGPYVDGGKLLGAYRLRINGRVVGVGPGRSRCQAAEAELYGCAEEAVYDGFDLRHDVNTALRSPGLSGGKRQLKVTLTGYGVDQSGWGLSPGMMAALVLRFERGPPFVLGTNSKAWRAFDMDSYYRPFHGSSAGTIWYSYPHEYIDTRCAPPDPDLALDLDLDSASTMAPTAEGFPGKGTRVCGEGRAGDATMAAANAVVRCPDQGDVIVAIEHASFGSPVGTCGKYKDGPIGPSPTFGRAPLAIPIVRGLCLLQSSCEVEPSGGTFSGFNGERLVIQAICAPPPPRCQGCWQAAVERQDAITAPLMPKPTAPLKQQYYSFAALNGSIRAGTAPGEFLLDAGREIQGGLRLMRLSLGSIPGTSTSTSTAAVTTTVRIRLSEQQTADGVPRVPMYSGPAYDDTWTLASGEAAAAAEHHEYMEWRFGRLNFQDAGAAPTLEELEHALQVWVVAYPFSNTPEPVPYVADIDAHTSVSTSSPQLDRVFELCRYTMASAPLDMYTDSNNRQRSIDCQADLTTTAQGQYATVGQEINLARYSAVEYDMRRGPAGYVDSSQERAVWADWQILPAINVVNDVLFTGELGAGHRFWPVLLANHTFREYLDPHTGLLNTSHLTALIDTSGGSQDGFVASDINAVANAWVYYSLAQLARLGTWLDDDQRHKVDGKRNGRDYAADVAKLQTEAAQLKASFQAHLVHPTTGVVCDGLCSNATTAHTAVHSSFYALSFGLLDAGDESSGAGAWEFVRNRGNVSGSYPSQFNLLALFAKVADHGAAGLARLTSETKHSWLHMLDAHAATCAMEAWDPNELPNLSFCHPWSASPAFVVPWYLFGVTPTAPGFSTFQVRPAVGTLRHGRMSMPTVRGTVRMSFEQDDQDASFVLNVTIPGNTRAVIFLPVLASSLAAGVPEMEVQLDGSPVASEMVFGGSYVRLTELVGAGEHVASIGPRASTSAAPAPTPTPAPEEVPWTFRPSTTFQNCTTVPVGRKPGENSSRWTFTALPEGTPPAAGWPVLVMFNLAAYPDQSGRNLSCGFSGKYPHRPPPPGWLGHGKPYNVWDPPLTAMSFCFANGSYTPGSCSYDQLGGALWEQRYKQVLLARGVAIVVVNSYEGRWAQTRAEWSQNTTRSDEAFFTTFFRSVVAGDHGPLDPSRVVLDGFSSGAHMVSWMIELWASSAPVFDGITLAGGVFKSGGSHRCFGVPGGDDTSTTRNGAAAASVTDSSSWPPPKDPTQPALTDCRGCNASEICFNQSAHRGLGCSTTLLEEGKAPCCQMCCPANVTEDFYLAHPEAYLPGHPKQHPPCFLAQLRSYDINSDLCAAKKYYDTLVAFGAGEGSELHLATPRDEHCYCVGTPGEPAAGGSNFTGWCSSVGDNVFPDKHPMPLSCMGHTLGFATLVEPLISFVLRVTSDGR